MAHVEVVLDRPRSQAFTYRVTPEQLPYAVPGSLVEVPFGRKQLYGIIVAFRRNAPTNLQAKLKSITRVIVSAAWAPPGSLKLAQRLSEYSGESLGTCLFRILPPPGKRAPHSQASLTAKPLQTPGKRFHLYGAPPYRHKQYEALIRRALARNQQVLLCAPLHHTASLKGSLDALGAVSTVSAELAPGKQRQLARAWRSGSIQVLIGTRHVIGWPAARLGIIIVDDPLSLGHTDEQRPYADSATIGLLRSEVEHCHIVLGSGNPTLGQVLAESTGRATKIHSSSPRSTLSILEHTRGSWILPQVMAHIASGNPVQIIAPRSGTGGSLTCDTCGNEMVCGLCRSGLQLLGSNIAKCYNCGHAGPWPETCSSCTAPHLKLTGIGADALRRDLVQAFGALPKNVIVGTEQLLDTPAQYVIFPYADSPLAAPSTNRIERYICRIHDTAGQAEQVLLLTRHPAATWWRTLGRGAAHAYAELLEERRVSGLPPYRRSVHLTSTRQISLPPLPNSVQSIQLSTPERGMITLLVPAIDWQSLVRRLHAEIQPPTKIRAGSMLEHL